MASPKRVPTHPGQMLLEEFLKPLGMTQKAFAQHLGTSLQRLNEIIRGKRSVTAETAWLFAGALGTSPELWTNLQAAHDLAKARPKKLPVPVLQLQQWHKDEGTETVIGEAPLSGASKKTGTV